MCGDQFMNTSIQQEAILIIDFGSQYTQLIARRIREAGVYCEILPFDVDPLRIEQFAPKGIILSGGPESVHEAVDVRAPSIIFTLGVPILGICYGMQTLVIQNGGDVVASEKHEYGRATVQVSDAANLLFKKTATEQVVWMSHGDQVAALGQKSPFKVIGSSENAPIAAIAHREYPWYGVQFHPEVTHTVYGQQILENFVQRICACQGLWTSDNIINHMVEQVRQQVGQDHVVLGLSGGVDSSVVAALLHQAIGSQLTCVFVDTGLLRLNEPEDVMQTFADHLQVNVVRVDAKQRFLKKLKGLSDPEDKRKAIGNLFVDIFDEVSQQYVNAHWLAQGTIYPDVIESADQQDGTAAHMIKSHHNVGGLPEEMGFKGLVEPLRCLFKDEVRRIGVALGVPYRMVYRHPFPGPGLGVRILGEIHQEYLEALKQADAIFIDVLSQFGWYGQVSQAFAVFLPVKTVGVVGDQRRYAHVIALRAVETIDFMTARWAPLPYELIDRAATRIVNELPQVARVVYDVTGKPPGTIEWE